MKDLENKVGKGAKQESVDIAEQVKQKLNVTITGKEVRLHFFAGTQQTALEKFDKLVGQIFAAHPDYTVAVTFGAGWMRTVYDSYQEIETMRRDFDEILKNMPKDRKEYVPDWRAWKAWNDIPDRVYDDDPIPCSRSFRFARDEWRQILGQLTEVVGRVFPVPCDPSGIRFVDLEIYAGKDVPAEDLNMKEFFARGLPQ